MLRARGVDFFMGDPLHHYMEVGLLRGSQERPEGTHDNVEDTHPTTPAAVEPLATAP